MAGREGEPGVRLRVVREEIALGPLSSSGRIILVFHPCNLLRSLPEQPFSPQSLSPPHFLFKALNVWVHKHCSCAFLRFLCLLLTAMELCVSAALPHIGEHSGHGIRAVPLYLSHSMSATASKALCRFLEFSLEQPVCSSCC